MRNRVLNLKLNKKEDVVNEKDVKVVMDETFGGCLKIEKSKEITLSKTLTFSSNNFTISFWIKVNDNNIISNKNGLIEGESEINSQLILIGSSNQKLFFQVGSEILESKEITIDEKWQYLTFCKDGEKDKISIWLNGELIGSKKLSSKINKLKKFKLMAPFSYKVANFRVYDCILEEGYIKEEFYNDIHTLSAFRKANPIEFKLLDENIMELLTITDKLDGYPLSFEIKNTSANDITIPENGEFELKFRPNTLSLNCKNHLNNFNSDRWKLTHYENSDYTYSLKFNSKNEQIFKHGTTISIPLKHMSAEASGGARGTKVELHYKGLHFGNDEEKLSGIRTTHMNIIKLTGYQTNPFHIDFISDNIVFNNGEEHILYLRVANPFEEVLKLNENSKFIFSFDSGNEEIFWALATKDEIKNIKTEVSDSKKWQINRDESSIDPTWELQPKNSIELKKGEGVTIKFSDICTTHSPGVTNLYTRYQNIIGFQDGVATSKIQKLQTKLFSLNFEGGNIIYSDKDNQNLKLSIANKLNSPIKLNKESEFILSFEFGEIIPKFAECGIYRKKLNSMNRQDSEIKGGELSWKITFKDSIELKKGDKIIIDFFKINIKCPIGISKLNIKYYNINSYLSGNEVGKIRVL